MKVEATGMAPLVIQATMTCPACGHSAVEAMPLDACQYFYECLGCHEVLRPKRGDCCVFCSYADTPCPPKQGGNGCDGDR